MSDIGDLPPLDLREKTVRIDRAIAGPRKSQAEAAKLRADRWIAPLPAGGAFIAVTGGLITDVLALLRHVGHG